jgi:hypothetical protein
MKKQIRNLAPLSEQPESVQEGHKSYLAQTHQELPTRADALAELKAAAARETEAYRIAGELHRRAEALAEALRLTEARSHVNSDGSYTVDQSAMDAVCAALAAWDKGGK